MNIYQRYIATRDSGVCHYLDTFLFTLIKSFFVAVKQKFRLLNVEKLIARVSKFGHLQNKMHETAWLSQHWEGAIGALTKLTPHIREGVQIMTHTWRKVFRKNWNTPGIWKKRPMARSPILQTTTCSLDQLSNELDELREILRGILKTVR